jgi:ribosomal protein S18 acetylase RimI-like enzyme
MKASQRGQSSRHEYLCVSWLRMMDPAASTSSRAIRCRGSLDRLRSAGAQDIGSVLSLWKVAGGPSSVSDTPEALAHLLTRDAGALVVAESDGVVVGSLIATWDGWRGSFYKLVVHPEHRRRGVATELLSEGQRRLRARGALRLTAIVVEDDLAATAFWEAAGYLRRPEQARFIQNVQEALAVRR